MTIHKSDAVSSGIMPDFAIPGVVLCRSAEFVTADDTIVSADTLQMVPIPKGAKVLRVEFYHTALPAGTTGCDVGYGGDPDAFLAGVDATGSNIRIWPVNLAAGPTKTTFRNLAGLLHTFTADDTIDIAFTKLATKIPTSQHLQMTVWYKMTGVLADEE
ncbi:MAG: hypothetical protein M0R06_00085 [Sphaerochaeta sp.]|jgi:hypothetical protein|nr:hypothetical protein [Sphaerochaeta sp.]